MISFYYLNQNGEHCRYFLEGIQRVAHRGGADDAPENTLAAVREVGEFANWYQLAILAIQAHARGSHAIEVDVAITKDGVPVPQS